MLAAIGVDNICGRSAEGTYGDCVILSRENLEVREVILGGQVVKRTVA